MPRTTVPMDNLSFDSSHDADVIACFTESAQRGERYDGNRTPAQNVKQEMNHLAQNFLRNRVRTYKMDNISVVDADMQSEA